VAGLRASRDKLLLELDEQAAEAQRLALENGVLQQARTPAAPSIRASLRPRHAQPSSARPDATAKVVFKSEVAAKRMLSSEASGAAQSLADVREAAGAWEAQAQSGLGQVERLKDLLEESARWSPQGADPGPDPSPAGAPRYPAPAPAGGAAEPAPVPGATGEGGADGGSGAAGSESGAGAPASPTRVAGDAAGAAGLPAAAQRAAAGAAEAARLRRTCAELEQQLRWQRAAAAGAPGSCRSAQCSTCQSDGQIGALLEEHGQG
jgi:hypothetical protein